VDFSHYSDEPVEMAVKLTNTLNVVTGEDALRTPEDAADFIRTELSGWGDTAAELTEKDLRAIRALRARLRSVWEADTAKDAAGAINEILVAVAARPRISVHGDTPPHLHFEPEAGDPVKDLGAVTAMGLSVALIEGGWERFGRCSSVSCDDVFIDTSKNRSRRHCSETCTTRDSVAAYRARQREGADGA
jgi:predicted RNA-binding Zn ribbon-like protein